MFRLIAKHTRYRFRQVRLAAFRFLDRGSSRVRDLSQLFPAAVRANEPHCEIRLETAAIIILPSPRTTAAWLVYFNRTTRFSPRLNTLFALRSISAFSFPPIDHKGGYRIDATRPARFHAYIDPRFFFFFAFYFKPPRRSYFYSWSLAA